MKIQITTKHYDFTLTSNPEREDSSSISDIFSRMATIITELQTAAEKAKAVVVDTQPNNQN